MSVDSMGELSLVRTALDEIKGMEHVLDASLVSKGGMYIMGGPPRGVHRETFAAMSAIIYGAAETTSTEMKDRLSTVTIDLSDQRVSLSGIGQKYILVVTMDKNSDGEKISKIAREIVSKVETSL